LESAFRAFDKNNNGYLTYKELRSIITDSGPCLSIENANLLLKELGYSDDNSQVINYKAFVSDSL
jgi:Ca2+-binding EF-hand superfamily protein